MGNGERRTAVVVAGPVSGALAGVAAVVSAEPEEAILRRRVWPQ